MNLHMYAFRKLLLIMALLFSSSISLFFDSCITCTILRLILLALILVPSQYEKVCIGLEMSGLLLSLILSVIQNPLFCENGCNVLLSSIPLASLCIFVFLSFFRALKMGKERPLFLLKEIKRDPPPPKDP
jgi:hypothetical protein